VVFIGIGLLIGAVRVYHFNEATVGRWDLLTDKVKALHGQICREVDYRRDKIQYTVCTDYGKLLVVGDLYPRFEYGDEVALTGKLVVPEPIETFKYDQYLFRFGITKISYRPQMALVSKGHGVLAMLFKGKMILLEQINRMYHEPFGSLIAGLVVGYRGGLADDLLEQFRVTGLTHIIAISGSNVALVVILLERLLIVVPKRVRLWLSIGGIGVFCVFVGLSASVVRAAIMGSLVLVARYFGRDNNVLNVLLLTAAVMALFVPPILANDAGFQLSFMAVVGILVFGKKVEMYFLWLKKWPMLKEAMVLTLAAQMGTLPLSLYLFQLLPLHSLLVNVTVVPLLPVAIMLACASLGVGVVFPLVGRLIAVVTSVILKLILVVVATFADLKFLVWEFDVRTAQIAALVCGVGVIWLGISVLRQEGL